MSGLFPITDLDILVELEREYEMRRGAYPRMIASGRIKDVQEAQRRCDVLREAIIRQQRRTQPHVDLPQPKPIVL